MALRLGEYVVYGEIRNTGNYSTAGLLVLRSVPDADEAIIHLALTGNCGQDLKGKHFRFRPREGEPHQATFDPACFDGVQYRQIGPTGTMTATGWVRVFDCPVEEYLKRSKLGEPPPTVWRRRLYLEWYSQNGRVLIEMADPILEECIRPPTGEKDEGEWIPIPHLTLPPDLPGTERQPDLGITTFEVDGDETHIEHWSIRDASDDDEDEFSTAPDELQRQLDKEARAIDRAIQDREHAADEDLAELELMDQCLEHSLRRPVMSLLKDIDKLPRPETLDDEAVEAELKKILTQLAMLNVALDVCDHCTPRDCYRMLLDEMLTDNETFEELIGTGWAQHMMISEYCPKCQAEAEEEYREYMEE